MHMNLPDSSVTIEHSPCPLGCPPSDEVVLTARDRLHDLPGQFTVVRCTHCRLMRTNPRPTADTIGFYYPEDYAPYHVSASVQARKRIKPASLRQRLRQRWRHALGLFDAKLLPVTPPGRMLEVGCASGGYMVEAIAQGWKVEGIEFSKESVMRTQKLGLSVQCGAIEDMSHPTQLFDLIVGWMVFEHVHDPLKTFVQLREWVQPHGWIAFSVPDSGALEFKIFGARWYALQVPGHMTHFTAATAAKLLEKSGWKMSRVIWHQNPNNLLHSLRYWAEDHGHQRMATYLADMIAGKRGRRAHKLLGRCLAVFRQSGRMTIWAQRTQ